MQDDSSEVISIVFHGGVGALLLCDLGDFEKSRKYDQPGSGGGNFFMFDPDAWSLVHGWTPIEGR